MTRPLGPGHLLVDPADAPLLAFLVRAGVTAVGARRALPRQVADLVTAVETAASQARSTAGTVACQGTAAPASWLTVHQTAEALHVSTSYVRRLCRTGALVADRGGPVWLIHADSITSHALRKAA